MNNNTKVRVGEGRRIELERNGEWLVGFCWCLFSRLGYWVYDCSFLLYTFWGKVFVHCLYFTKNLPPSPCTHFCISAPFLFSNYQTDCSLLQKMPLALSLIFYFQRVILWVLQEAHIFLLTYLLICYHYLLFLLFPLSLSLRYNSH